MELYVMDDQFFKTDPIIDKFISAIWTERYRGDGDFEIVVEATTINKNRLLKESILMCQGSIEPMILEERDIKDGLLKVTGITLTQWLNNRFIRTSNDPAVQDWKLTDKAADIMANIVQQMCVGGPYLDGTIPIGIPAGILAVFVVPGLQSLSLDHTGPTVTISIPFGPVYDALKQIADTYDVGQRITLDGAYDDYYILSYNSYKGADRTSAQSVNPVIQFSKDMDSFTEIHDFESIKDHKNYVFNFLSNPPAGYTLGPGFTDAAGGVGGFHLRALQMFNDNLDTTGLTESQIYNIINQQAIAASQALKVVSLVDGQIVQVEGVKYGTDFFMGDLVEVKGNNGVLQTARVTEYIRSKDATGERSYPGLTFIE